MANPGGYSENTTIEQGVARVLERGLPDQAWARIDLLRLHLGDGLCDALQLEGPKQQVARHLAVRLLRDFGGIGRAGLKQLIDDLVEMSTEPTWIAEVRGLLARIDAYQPPPFRRDAAAPPVRDDQLDASILRTVVHDAAPMLVTPETIDDYADAPAVSMQQYLTKCVADAERQPAVDDRFVALSLLLDRRNNGKPQGSERYSIERSKYNSLREALEANDDSELVVVGPPGAGKSTLCRRLRLELCRDALKKVPGRLPFMAHLGDYGKDPTGRVPKPDEWLADQWRAVMPAVPFEEALARHRFVLLLDALNEMPREDEADLSRRIQVWQRWLARFHDRTGGQHRVVFTCRIRDLSASLSSATRKVRLLEIDSLDDHRVERFIEAHAGAWGDTIRGRLKTEAKLRDLYRTPLSLTLLLDLVDLCGDVPRSPAALFTGHLCQALKRELERPNPRFAAGGLLTPHDRAHMATRPYDVDDPYILPDEGPLFRALAGFAYAMQLGDRAERSHVVMRRGAARALYDELAVAREVSFDDLLAAGADLGLIVQHTNKVAFVRQPHQEYLAAKAWADAGARRDYGLVAPPWTDADRHLDAVVDGLLEDEPLPAPPSTGWEETVLMGAEMAEDAGVIDGLEAVNPPLAGQACALRDDSKRRSRLQARLLRDTEDPDVDLRVRIRSGEALGRLGHPRFIERDGPYGRYVEPPLVAIPGGAFTMGSDDDYGSERPAHTQRVAAFWLGRYPVTRAEFAGFVQAKGYEDPKWWVGDAAQRWLSGEGVGDGRKEVMRENRRTVIANPSMIDSFTPPQQRFWRARVAETDPAFESFLSGFVETGKQTEPKGWNEQRDSNPTAPVTGVCLFEAMAYIQWLNAQTGRGFCLPTERQWERAARGLAPSSVFPWGDEPDPKHRMNVYESHVRGLTPVGAFPSGQSREGVMDLSGLVWEWTASGWSQSHEARGRSETDRVVRGGSWFYPLRLARGRVVAGARSTTGATASVFVCAFRPPSRIPEP